MDLEAMQLLNLSPIPELSEIELSSMLDHLSGLSDINGDLTDRNVEDILKEAEDLLDLSTSSKMNESKSKNKSPEAEENTLTKIKENESVLKNEEQNLKPCDLNEKEHNSVSISNNYQMDIFIEDNATKHCNSPVDNSPPILYSPRSSSNHIKSTIDSLKEFSIFIEKKLTTQPPDLSLKNIESTKKNKTESSDKEDKFSSSYNNKKSYNTKQIFGKPSDLITKKNLTQTLDKSVKLLNCFERLYRDKPVRLTCKKSRVVDKMPKTVIKKKNFKDLGSNKKNSWQTKLLEEKIIEEDVNAKVYQKASQSFQQTSYVDKDFLKPNKMNSKYNFFNDNKCLLQNKISHNKTENESLQKNCMSDNFQVDSVKFVQSRTDEKWMEKGLKGLEEIKNEVKKISVLSDGENLEKIIKEDKKDVDILKLEADLAEGTFTPDSDKNSGIKRLEEQFFALKGKYNYQIKKLEAENFRLKEALSTQQNNFIAHDFFKFCSNGIKTESVLSFSPSCIPEKKISRTVFLENCKVPKNSPCSSPDIVQMSTAMKEAFSQTEKELKSASVQCTEESGNMETNNNTAIISETKKIENKENLIFKRKSGRSKPFSDVNIHQPTRQKKPLEAETQLLATLRGLQAEVGLKDKENRKLKNEIDSLKRQIKKSANVKLDSCKKCNIGTQTIGLGSFVHKPYNPENYEVPMEFEKENEDLRSRIKALEEDFELLKKKRISDLQSLHQVHEEEMAKLVSKLETQSALTKHLHSLLVNR